MSKRKTTKAVLTADGKVLIEQPDGSFKYAVSKTDTARLKAMKDKDIDYSDIPELDDDFWANAELIEPDITEQVTLRLKKSVLSYFKSKGTKGYQTRINAVLESYVQAHKKNRDHRPGR